MNRRFAILAAAAALGAGLVAACFTAPSEDVDSEESRVETVDPLEGAYEKIAGTPVHFVFKRAPESGRGSFIGELGKGAQAQRATGAVELARDNFGTTMKLTPVMEPVTASERDATAPPPDGGTDAGASDAGAPSAGAGPAEAPAGAAQVFNGTLHYLKIGKNNTILVRSDETGTTSQYKKLPSWCGSAGAADCTSDVQATALECADDKLECKASRCSCK